MENCGFARSLSKIELSLILHSTLSIINFAFAHAIADTAAPTRASPVKKSIMFRVNYTKRTWHTQRRRRQGIRVPASTHPILSKHFGHNPLDFLRNLLEIRRKPLDFHAKGVYPFKSKGCIPSPPKQPYPFQSKGCTPSSQRGVPLYHQRGVPF